MYSRIAEHFSKIFSNLEVDDQSKNHVITIHSPTINSEIKKTQNLDKNGPSMNKWPIRYELGRKNNIRGLAKMTRIVPTK